MATNHATRSPPGAWKRIALPMVRFAILGRHRNWITQTRMAIPALTENVAPRIAWFVIGAANVPSVEHPPVEPHNGTRVAVYPPSATIRARQVAVRHPRHFRNWEERRVARPRVHAKERLHDLG